MIELNEAERQKIRKVVAAASQGKWTANYGKFGELNVYDENDDRITIDISEEDAALIVGAREWLTGLLDKVDSLILENNEMHGSIQRWHERVMRVEKENASLKAELGQPTPPANLKPLSNKQSEAYRFISDFIRRNQYSPTTREIQDAMGYASSSTAHHITEMLERKGYIKRMGKRGIVLVSEETKKDE
ncbi:LexA DNA binding domain-containing protein [Paenibacillus algorifonticola]|uniref:LexA DNA binding domain-containing protein n=1 Tax=Paenibacillus algorifonticola TaxID=684063 RepID=A0A1I2H258_9BACL|nr:hypothetical protein [Paenibacillus algorifonticola]SFF22801.1 LexA DNA binding domain-containing protein [Paenibacillus algorifonticola]